MRRDGGQQMKRDGRVEQVRQLQETEAWIREQVQCKLNDKNLNKHYTYVERSANYYQRKYRLKAHYYGKSKRHRK
jgi:hypothetical protein